MMQPPEQRALGLGAARVELPHLGVEQVVEEERTVPGPGGRLRGGRDWVMSGCMRYCLALDLKDDPDAIAAYEAHHRAVWPEVVRSLGEAGVLGLELYRTGDRLFMILETGDGFSFERKEAVDAANPRVREWEALMATFQRPLPWARPGSKWTVMERICVLP